MNVLLVIYAQPYPCPYAGMLVAWDDKGLVLLTLTCAFCAPKTDAIAELWSTSQVLRNAKREQDAKERNRVTRDWQSWSFIFPKSLSQTLSPLCCMHLTRRVTCFFKDIRLSTNQWRARLLWGNLTLWRIIRLKSVYISLLRLDIVIRRQVFFFFLFLKLIHFKAFKIPSITQVKRSRSACGFA